VSDRELLLCPFCRSVASVHETDWCEPPEFNVFCAGCMAQTSASTDRAKAVSAWNRRATPKTKP
jgi:Lar family restriction alleviation protein